ncbi:MAG: helix-turn-helix transcriptional regulator, partial [Lysobacter sp.]
AVLRDERTRRAFESAFLALTATSSPMAHETALLRLLQGADVNATERAVVACATAASIQRARECIEDDPARPWSLAQLASEAGIGRLPLIRGFACELGLTPHAFIVQRRLAMARRLIRAGAVPAEAALQAGFYDQSHLNRCFVRQFGVTPRSYAHG